MTLKITEKEVEQWKRELAHSSLEFKADRAQFLSKTCTTDAHTLVLLTPDLRGCPGIENASKALDIIDFDHNEHFSDVSYCV